MGQIQQEFVSRGSMWKGKPAKKMILTLTPLENIPLIAMGDEIAAIISGAINKMNLEIHDEDIFILAQKIVSKSEGRLINLNTVTPSRKAKALAKKTSKDARFIELVLSESSNILRSKPGTIIAEHHKGFICANAGIDHSNVQGDSGSAEDWVLLLPENPDKTAELIRKKLEKIFKKHLGVMIIDSHGRPWRLGTVGVAIGISGIPGVVDMRGWEDLFGYKLRVTQVAAADELAAAASLVMGQAAEGTPIVHARGFPYPLREATLEEMIRPRKLDLFR
jgi:coenzyme F420-0:L-glutamate ligase / coenzyme F420-1:gamma-L-glutamate ligase